MAKDPDRGEQRKLTRNELLQREAERKAERLWRKRVNRMARGTRYGYWK